MTHRAATVTPTARRPNRGAAFLCGLLAAFCSVSIARAQYHIDSWTTENGLPGTIVRDVCQTPDGYLWLATLNGLVRFDGVRFTVFDHSNTPGIADSQFTTLYCPGGDEFWATTVSSGVTRYHQGRFSTYAAASGLPPNNVRAVCGDGAGHIWILLRGSIASWNPVASRFAVLPPAPQYLAFAGSIWFGWFGRGFGFWGVGRNRLHLFVRGKFLDYPLPRNWPHDAPTTAGRDLNGVIWLAAANGRLEKLSGGRWVSVPRGGAERARAAARSPLASTYRDSRGDLFHFGIGNPPGVGLIQYLTLPLRRPPQRIVFNSFFEDREGSVWLPTDGQGLYRLRKAVVSMYSEADGLPDQNIFPIYQDHSGVIWIGTWTGGLARFSEGRFTNISAADGLTATQITSIFEDRDDNLWVGSRSGLYERRHGRFHFVRAPLLLGKVVLAIDQDREGALWFGTDQGLLRFKNDDWTLLTAKDGLASDDVRVIINGRAGEVWFGGYGGLTRLDHSRFKHWTERDGLPSNTVRSLYEDAKGVLWIGTYDGGLGRFKNGKFTRYTAHDGLFDNGVFQILQDNRGYLWMSCYRGIYCVSKKELTEYALGKRSSISSRAFDRSDGMYNAECNGGHWPAGIRARDGKLWFPTQDGVAVIDPSAVPTNPEPPPVVIESILLDRQPRLPDRALRVPPGSENLEIQYAALSFLDSKRICFKYKLMGLDRNWVDAGPRRTAYYSHLPPGRYVFKVIAANSDGVWNRKGKSLPIVVLPAFYQTWWFLTLASLIGAGSVAFAWQFRVSQLRRPHAAQQAFSRQLIASQEAERKRIAAELHDSLGQHLVVIKNLALISLNDGFSEAESRSRIEEISAEASHALSEVREISYNLRPYQLDRIGLTKAIQAIVKNASAATRIAFQAEIDEIDGVLPKDAEINFYRIVQECVNNVVKHSQAKTAGITVRRAGGALQLTVRDDGRGFTPGAASPEGAQGGFGLIGITERAQLLGGKGSTHSAPGNGTTISIEIPLGEDGHGR